MKARSPGWRKRDAETGQDIRDQEIVSRFLGGTRPILIAAHFGISRERVRQILKRELGITRHRYKRYNVPCPVCSEPYTQGQYRAHARAAHHAFTPATEAKRKAVAALYLSGSTGTNIAVALDLYVSDVYRMLDISGIPRRKIGGYVRRYWRDEEVAEIEQAIANGESIRSIGRRLGRAPHEIAMLRARRR